MLNKNPELKKAMELDKFQQKIVSKKGIQGEIKVDPNIFKANNQIMRMEEMFEKRRIIELAKATKKSKVIGTPRKASRNQRNIQATPQFL